jgi:hypothetical protein
MANVQWHPKQILRTTFQFTGFILNVKINYVESVPDHGSWDRDVVSVSEMGKPKGGQEFGMGRGWGGMRKGRSVYEQPGTKVDRDASCQRRVSK